METTQRQETTLDNQNQFSGQAIKIYLTVKEFARKHSTFSESALRWLIFNRSTNGFGGCFRKIGKRILVDEAAFFKIIDSSKMEA